MVRATGAALFLALFVRWPAPSRIGRLISLLPKGILRFAPHGSGQEYTWRGAILLVGNSYVIAGVVAIIGTAAYLWATRGRPRMSAPTGTADHPWPWRGSDRPTPWRLRPLART